MDCAEFSIQEGCTELSRYCDTSTSTYWECTGGIFVDTGETCTPSEGGILFMLPFLLMGTILFVG